MREQPNADNTILSMVAGHFIREWGSEDVCHRLLSLDNGGDK